MLMSVNKRIVFLKYRKWNRSNNLILFSQQIRRWNNSNWIGTHFWSWFWSFDYDKLSILHTFFSGCWNKIACEREMWKDFRDVQMDNNNNNNRTTTILNIKWWNSEKNISNLYLFSGTKKVVVIKVGCELEFGSLRKKMNMNW